MLPNYAEMHKSYAGKDGGVFVFRSTLSFLLVGHAFAILFVCMVQEANATTITLATSGSTSFAGDSVTFTATVAGNAPTGTVNFMADGATIGCDAVGLLAGIASCTTSFVSAGTRSITADYSGDVNNPAIPATLSGGQLVLPRLPQNVGYPNGILPVNRSTTDAENSYTVWKSSYVTSSGANGLRRVVGDNCTSCTVSEGIGYGMLLAVHFNDKALFDDLWGYYKLYMNTNGLMSWMIRADGVVVDPNAATDADEDAAFALVLADKQWGSAGYNYLQDASNLINAIMAHEVEAVTFVLKPGDVWGGSIQTNPSYFAPAYYRVFQAVTSDANWGNVISASYGILQKAVNPITGLVPDWCDANGAAINPLWTNSSYDYTYDAVRTPLRIAMDYLWYGTPTAQTFSQNMANFVNGIGIASVMDGYRLDGTMVSAAPAHNSAFVGTFAVAPLAAGAAYQALADASYAENVAVAGNNYYNSSLRALTLLLQTGNFLYPAINYLTVNKVGTGNVDVIANSVSLPWNSNVSTKAYFSGTQVTLSAVAAADSIWAGWGGDCTGTGGCVVTMDIARTITVSVDLDVTPPSIPTGLMASPFNSSRIDLSWGASTDNVGVTGYNVYRDGVLVGNSATTNYSDTGLASQTTYGYTVAACDAANNCSATSGSVSGTTLISQTITFGTAPVLFVGSNGAVSATATSGLAVTYSSITPAVCTVSANSVAAISVGTCTIAANQAGDATYSAAPQVTQDIAVTTRGQIITFAAMPALYVRRSVALNVTATSGLPVVLSSVTPAVCQVVGNNVTALMGGLCTVAANQAGDANYSAAAQVAQSIVVRPVQDDFNGDGKSDILWRNLVTGANTIWKSGNGATLQAVAAQPVAWVVAGTGDFDGDGKNDILWRNSTTGANAIWKSGNAATKQAVTALPLVWAAAGTGDFDGDGKSDILWRNNATGANVIWKSANSATKQLVATLPLVWSVVGAGDFDGDGKRDILWRNNTTGASTIWRAGNVAAIQAVSVLPLAWVVVGTGDFDGDGKSDILWRNNTTGANIIWRAGNVVTKQAVSAAAVANIMSDGMCDFDGDGKSDILWRNNATGANIIWRSANSATRQAVPPQGANWIIAR